MARVRGKETQAVQAEPRLHVTGATLDEQLPVTELWHFDMSLQTSAQTCQESRFRTQFIADSL
jgi:hypothetical protein